MTECREALTAIYNYLDGELTDQVRVEIRRHLDDCPPCDGVFVFEAEIKTMLATRCRDAAPEGLRRRIAEALGLDHVE